MSTTAPIPAKSLLPRINRETRGGTMLSRLVAFHPSAVRQSELMHCAGMSLMGALSAPASFHYWRLQINDQLRPLGWQMVERSPGYYGLEEAV